MVGGMYIHTNCNIAILISIRFDSDVIYGDTDSIFVALYGFCDDITDPASRAEAYAVGTYMAQYITKKAFSGAIKLEFEKIYDNLNMIGPKNYSGRKWLINELDPKNDIKGLGMIKRGPCKFIKDTCKAVNKMIIMEDNYEGALQYAAKRIDMLNTGSVPIGDLIQVQKLSQPLSKYGKEKIVTNASGVDVKKKSAIGPYVKLAIRQNNEEKFNRRKSALNAILDEFTDEFNKKNNNVKDRIARNANRAKSSNDTDGSDESDELAKKIRNTFDSGVLALRTFAKKTTLTTINDVNEFIKNFTGKITGHGRLLPLRGEHNTIFVSEIDRITVEDEQQYVDLEMVARYFKQEQYFFFMLEQFGESMGIKYTTKQTESRYSVLYDDTDAVTTGDVISVVVIKKEGQVGAAKSKGDNVEDPLVVFKEKIPIDYDYYKESLIKHLVKITGNVVKYYEPTTTKTTQFDLSSAKTVSSTTTNKKRKKIEKEEKNDEPSQGNNAIIIADISEGDLGHRKQKLQKENKRMRKKLKTMEDNYTMMDEKQHMIIEGTLERKKYELKALNAQIKEIKNEKHVKVINEIQKRSKNIRKNAPVQEGKGLLKNFIKAVPQCIMCYSSMSHQSSGIVDSNTGKPCDWCKGKLGQCKHRMSRDAPDICENCSLNMEEIINNEKAKYIKVKKDSSDIWENCRKCMDGNMAEAKACVTLQCQYHSIRHMADNELEERSTNLDTLKTKCSKIIKDKSILDW